MPAPRPYNPEAERQALEAHLRGRGCMKVQGGWWHPAVSTLSVLEQDAAGHWWISRREFSSPKAAALWLEKQPKTL